MNTAVHNSLISFIWSIADDCLRDVYVRGKYRDVILPMVVLRRLDALLEPGKDKVMEELVFQRDEAGFTEWDEAGLRDASGYVFYNTSEVPMKWAFENYGDRIYNDLAEISKEIIDWCEKNEFDLTAGKRKALSSPAHWEKHRALMQQAKNLQKAIGNDEHKDFNIFKEDVEMVLKDHKIKLTPSEKKAIYNAISRYDKGAAKVIKNRSKLSGNKLENLLQHLDWYQQACILQG